MEKIEAIKQILAEGPKDTKELMALKRLIARRFGVGIIDNSDILSVYIDECKKKRCKPAPLVLRLLRKRAIRTMSGIAPVAVLTKPYLCPGNCAFCPTEKDVPQSYLSNEPAVMRAIRCDYDPFVQVQDRLRALERNGHEPTKIELIVIGGTWSYLPLRYRYWYIVNLFAAANRFFITNQRILHECTNRYKASLSLTELKAALLVEQKKNERAKYQIIGLTLETRPDYIDAKELDLMREFGCTRVELGVQIVDDEVLKFNKRGHGVAEIAEATRMLRERGFKITYHLMPGLPSSTPANDLKRFKQLFSDERFQPDQIKFYPTVVTKGSLLYKWWKAGRYKPYSDKVLKKLIVDCKRVVPEYVRIIRLIRDIPGESIEAGNKITNLRQVLKQEGVDCRCIRCREVGNQFSITNYELRIIDYRAAGGVEYFISYNSPDDKILYGFCRLWLGDGGVAMIRELHVYGELVPVGGEKKVQHAGLGRKLLAAAEALAKKRGCAKMQVISGVGVRGYYRKLGYRLRGTYMVKKLD